MTTVYVIQETHFEYNDEYYHTGYDGESGNPVCAFSNKEKAEAICFQKNLEQVKRLTGGDKWYTLSYYSDEGYSGVVKGDALEMLDNLGFDPYDDDWSSLTDEQRELIAANLQTPFYSVYELEIE